MSWLSDYPSLVPGSCTPIIIISARKSFLFFHNLACARKEYYDIQIHLHQFKYEITLFEEKLIILIITL